jgi:hypothetical protein
MAAPYNPPVKNEDFQMGIALEDMNNPGQYKSNPTISAGDFKVSKDFDTFNNLTSLPDVAPASGVQVRIQLSNTEMNADVVSIWAHDQTDPPEWADWFLTIPTTQ